MFKRGQLVRSRISNLFGVVVSANRHSFKLRMVSGNHKGKTSEPLLHDDEYCELVGNNYKEVENV